MYPAPPVTNMLCAIIAEPEQWTETEKTLQIITIKKKNRSSNVTEKIGHFTEASTLPCNLKNGELTEIPSTQPRVKSLVRSEPYILIWYHVGIVG